jgi:hypothetical protein
MHTILYVHCVELLMWSTKNRFPILWFFSELLYFFKDLVEIIKIGKSQNHYHCSKPLFIVVNRLQNRSREVMHGFKTALGR